MGIPLAPRHSVCLPSLEDRVPAGAKSVLAACNLRGPNPGIEVNNILSRPLGRVDNSWVNLRRLGNQLGGILEPFVLVIILS